MWSVKFKWLLSFASHGLLVRLSISWLSGRAASYLEVLWGGNWFIREQNFYIKVWCLVQLQHIPLYHFLHAVTFVSVAAAADPSWFGALETTVPTFCHLAPRQPSKARTPPAHCQELLSPLAWAVTHFLQLQTLSGSLTGSALARSHGWGSFFLTHGLCFTCLQSQNSKSSPSTASLCLQANNCCPSRASFLPLQTGSPSSSIKTALPFCSIKFSCCYTELPLPRLNSI